MKNAVKWIIIAALLVGLLAGATALYNKYSEEYDMNNQVQNEETTEEKPSDSEQSTKPQKNENSAPDFTVVDYNGNEVKLSDFKGKPVVLNFWTTWCYYCKVEMPHFNEAYKEYPDVQFLMVNAMDNDTVEAAKAFVEEEQYEFDIFFDMEYEAVMTYNVTGYPRTIFIDKDGNISSTRIGMLTKDTLEQEIKKITE